jgi:hypothetical protein
MSISATDSTSAASALPSSSSVRATRGAGRDRDGDNDGARVSGAGKGGRFASAIQQALSQLGIGASGGTPSTSASGSSSDAADATKTQDPAQALAAFAQSLFAALHAQSSGASSTVTPEKTEGTTAVDGLSATGDSSRVRNRERGGVARLEKGLEGLLQKLNAGAATTGTAAAADTTSTSSSSASLSDLQKSFNNLLSADGATGTNDTLSNFLQTLVQKLDGAPPTGNVVNTKA